MYTNVSGTTFSGVPLPFGHAWQSVGVAAPARGSPPRRATSASSRPPLASPQRADHDACAILGLPAALPGDVFQSAHVAVRSDGFEQFGYYRDRSMIKF